MRIVQLNSENVKRLSAVEIRPGDNGVVVIGGANGQGKSSVLDSIMYALAGGKSLPEVPIRRGQTSAKVKVDLGTLVVERTFSDKGTSRLTVKSKEGATYPSAQTMLDELVGSLSFDPLAFSRLKPADQAQALRDLVGLDFAELDAQRQGVYDQRTQVNREVKAIEARIAASPKHDDAPAKEQSIGELTDELEKRQSRNRSHQQQRDELEQTRREVDDAAARIVVSDEVIADLQRRLDEAKDKQSALILKHDALKSQLMEAETIVSALKDADEQAIRDQLRTVEDTNRKVRENQQRQQLERERAAAAAEAAQLTETLRGIDADKADQLQNANFPVEGLSFDQGGVLLGGLPFEQASSAEKLRVSVAMGLAANPKLRVLLVRDGSLLDPDNLTLLAQMATEAGAQVWVERVSEGDEVTVVIEDGQVREPVTA